MILPAGARTISFFIAITFLSTAALYSCGGSTSSTTSSDAVYPMFTDANTNSINDYFEAATHDAGSTARTAGPAYFGHEFIDADGDGVCDYAQNGSPTWHGPGFIDENGNGICDYWESGTPMHNRNLGMWAADSDGNGVSDYFEQMWHQGYGHEFTDADGDGVCDYAQNGGADIWHGPNYVDEDGDGVCDFWQSGGRGYGPMMNGGPAGPMGPMMQGKAGV